MAEVSWSSPVMPEPTNLPLPHLHGQGQSYGPYLHSEGRLVQPWPSVEPIVAFPEEEELFNEMNKVTLFWFREWPLRIKGGRHHWCKALEAKGERVIHLLTKRDKTLKIDSNCYITVSMEQRLNASSNHTSVWNTYADFVDEHPNSKLLQPIS